MILEIFAYISAGLIVGGWILTILTGIPQQIENIRKKVATRSKNKEEDT